eukprot:TRINITY_DN4649_c0_g1_i1.p1 TRINITY_DN4649_c0_g1~~TRINITY_DN4649_c0_g1_i1.p1  ORF type:complete len:317 (-),score=67.07 TRINITY_DN4649_c0_g1_i1:90-1040(-)
MPDFVCEVCGQSFDSPLHRRKHALAHSTAAEPTAPSPVAVSIDPSMFSARLQHTLQNGLRGGGSPLYPQLVSLLDQGQRSCDRCQFIKRVGLKSYMAGTHMEECNEAMSLLHRVAEVKLHFMLRFNGILSDTPRLECFRAAVTAAVEDGCTWFLCMGVGSMVPALRAAQLGARVVVCEESSFLREVAEAVAAENGQRGRVRVVSDIPQDATFDACVSEDVDLTLGGMCRGMARAKQHSLEEEAVMIPARATMRCVGVELLSNNQCGVDLQAFDRFRYPCTPERPPGHQPVFIACLLYTSDAADEEDSVDLGGRRII